MTVRRQATAARDMWQMKSARERRQKRRQGQNNEETSSDMRGRARRANRDRHGHFISKKNNNMQPMVSYQPSCPAMRELMEGRAAGADEGEIPPAGLRAGRPSPPTGRRIGWWRSGVCG